MDQFFLFQRAFASLWIYSALLARTQSSHTSRKKLSLCQHFCSSTALLGFSLALSYNEDIPYSQIPIKSIHGKRVIPNLYRFRIHGTKRSALELCSMQEWQERKAGCLPQTSPVKLIPSCWCTTQNFLSSENINRAMLWKSISIFRAAISQGDILAALLSAVFLVILHAWHKLNKVSLHSIDFSLESMPHILDTSEGKK